MKTTHARQHRIEWPGNASFAFTIFDDTDRATLENNRAVYGLLEQLGLRTTKSVWVRDGASPASIPGITCDDAGYLEWLQKLQQSGFEIAWHNSTWETSRREATIAGLDRFRDLFGHDPASMANHAENEEGIYWGAARLSGWRRAFAGRLLFPVRFSGHDPASPLFWGDLCRERIRYVRNFTFSGIDTLADCPSMPYHDPSKPFVSRWFSASAGADVREFTELIDPANVDSLEQSGGACIVYTHFGKGFVGDSGVDPLFRERIESLASRKGWFPTVTGLLEYLESLRPQIPVLSPRERAKMEARWLRDRIRHSLRGRLRPR